jgi:predicted nucleotidyltransferase component of viral defense system
MDDKILIKLAAKEKVPIGTIDKDYAVTSILFLISQFPKIDKMVFKGGTALKKVHFSDFRFSEDIDFTCLEDVSEELYSLLDSKKDSLDFTVTNIKKETTVGNSKKFTVKYNGFKNYPNNVRVDLSLREKIQNESSNLKIVHNYSEIPLFSIPSMTVEEIMAEKVRAVIYSGAPRHLYDLNYLFAKRISLNPELVRTKISLYGEDFSIEKFRKSIGAMAKDWIRDLRSLMPQDPPPVNEVSNNVLQKISEVMQ